MSMMLTQPVLFCNNDESCALIYHHERVQLTGVCPFCIKTKNEVLIK